MLAWRTIWSGALAAAFLTAAPGIARGQATDTKITTEVRGGVNVPTFDIADVAKVGPSFGVGVGLKIAPRWSLLADADFGFHDGEDLPGGGQGPDVSVFHYIGKVAYHALEPGATRWSLRLNAGAGAMMFDVDGIDTYTYLAINVGAKISYAVSDRFDLFVSPQGDIAFADEAEVGTDNAWVWPFAAGARVSF